MSQMFGDHWDPSYYSKNSQMQYNTSIKIIEDIKCTAPNKILDLGSGDGKITYYLSKKYALSQTIGLDISAKMTSYANRKYNSYKQLKFIQMDMLDLNFVNEFDLIVSFWAFAWVQEHETILKKIINALTPTGVMHLLVPLNSPTLEQTIFHTCADTKWNKYFVGMHFPNMITHELYENIIARNNMVNIHLHKTKISYVFQDHNELKGYLTAWIPLLQYIPELEKDSFIENLLTYYKNLLLLEKNNPLSVTFDCIIVTNVKM